MIHLSRLVVLFGYFFLSAVPADAQDYYWGADLSYVNEMNDCGVTYSDNGKVKEAYKIFKDHGANIARIRLWHTPDWTPYSTLKDVKRSIKRAKDAGLQVLLDFHYSDDWADGEKQVIPAAWAGLDSVEAQSAALYDYTYAVLKELHEAGLLPEMVQVGNETNGEIMRANTKIPNHPINWARNGALFNAGIKAVRDMASASDKKIGVMLHIAQPENVEPWFEAATQAGVTDYDFIGISYYRKWSSETFEGLGKTINRMHHQYDAEIILVETAYPWTNESMDTLPNLLGPDTLMPEYPATIEGQTSYLTDLSQLVIANGGVGVIYWEPAWVSSDCKTRWGTGSSWENATFFDFSPERNLLPSIDFMTHDYSYPVPLSFELQAPASFTASQVILKGDFIGQGVAIVLKKRDGVFRFETTVMPGQEINYQIFLNAASVRGIIDDTTLDANGYVMAVTGTQRTHFSHVLMAE